MTPELLKAEFENAARPLGFALAKPYTFGSHPDLGISAKKLAHHEGTEVAGWFYLERDLRVDRAETRQRDRKRWIGVVGGFVSGAILVYFAFREPYPGGLLAAPGGVLFGVGLTSGLSFADVDYWSDVIAVRLLADLPPSTKPDRAPTVPANYVAQCWVVRALSQDWEAKTGSGRSIHAAVDFPGLDSVRATLRASFVASPLR